MSKQFQITIDLKRVALCKFWWQNQEGDKRRVLPHRPTVHGNEFDSVSLAHHHPEYALETTLERARRLDILDVWTPICVLYFTKYHTVRYEGNKAIKMHEAYKAHIYGRKK